MLSQWVIALLAIVKKTHTVCDAFLILVGCPCSFVSSVERLESLLLLLLLLLLFHGACKTCVACLCVHCQLPRGFCDFTSVLYVPSPVYCGFCSPHAALSEPESRCSPEVLRLAHTSVRVCILCTCVCTYIYIYIYIKRERERDTHTHTLCIVVYVRHLI